MSDEHKSYNPIANKLREMGLVPMPRWWVTPVELEIISRITKTHLPTVLKVKEEIRQEQDLVEIEEQYKHGRSYDE
jgi:hypothetical protein